jgi:hypothetical protein
MFKIANLQTSEANSHSKRLAKLFEGMCFSITIQNSNSNQMDSDIDVRIIEKISDSREYTVSKSDSLVFADGEKFGELDLVFRDRRKISYYMEIEKSNKKTLWFDYIKILTKLESDSDGLGIMMCPVNYAHSIGVWNLYQEAVIYKNHLKRVFGSNSIDRVSVLGYTQYAFLDRKWQKFDSNVVKRIKN